MGIILKKRLKRPGIYHHFIPVVSILLSLGIGAILFLVSGVNPVIAYIEIFKGSFGSLYNFSEVLVRATPLIFCGLAVGIAGKMQLWNIGAEGQLVMGGITGTGVGLFIAPHFPAFLGIFLMLIAGFIGGGLWGLLPGILRARWRVSEIITTLMLNYVAIIWMEHLYFGPWRDPEGRGFPGTAVLAESLQLPRFWGTRIHAGLFIALAFALVIMWIFSFTRWGYKLRVIGENAKAAGYAGIPINRNIILVMFLSGALAGLSGIIETAGIHYRLQQGLAVGSGYVGIIIAWLSGLNPLATIAVSILLGALMTGGDQIQIVMHVPSSIGLVLEAIILFCVIGGKVFSNYTLSFRRGNP
ncbi:MAG TPA: ABC transporter permease [Desulfobacteraceae bacterium]|nr:ABC transporter permease [Desulfobacteraceae bacterium]